MTPGIHPMSVSKMLTRNVVPIPCFMKTAKGGNKIFKMIVTNDMNSCFYLVAKWLIMYNSKINVNMLKTLVRCTRM